MSPEPLTIIQVLLLFDALNSRDLGLALWAALVEIEQFYNLDKQRAAFQRYYVSPFVPRRSGPIGSAVRPISSAIRSALGWTPEPQSALDYLRQEERRETDLARFDPREKPTDGTRFMEYARGLVSETSNPFPVVVFTDREITPPRDSRYSLWHLMGDNAIISMRPMDPRYWRDQDPNRGSTIKQRVRAAGLLVTGTLLNFRRCENPHCFLYEDIGSVTTLDFTTELGKEHAVPALAGRGFQSSVVMDPTLVQPVV
jgi:hypothetical protein